MPKATPLQYEHSALIRTRQSGDPRSPFYDNLLEGWAEDKACPLLYSREKILAHKALAIHLSPK